MIKYKNWREKKMTELQEGRRKIYEIDNQMVELFEKRMKVCEEVAEYKIHTGKKVLDPEREHAKLEEIRKKAHGEFNELGAQELFQQIMAISDCCFPGGRRRLQLWSHARLLSGRH